MQMEKELDYIIGQFPTYRHQILQLFHENADFRSLCYDYWECKHNLSMLKGNVMQDERTKNNYQMLRLDLEQEISRYLHTISDAL